MTLSLKNGMQFRVSGAKDWITVLPYNASSTKTDSAVRSTSDKTTFDPYKENTQVKISYMAIDDVKAILGSTAPAADQPIVLETRIAATVKKAPSRTAVVTIPVQGEAPKADITYDGKQWTISGITAADTSAPQSFEYTIVKQGDVTDNKLDISTLKWGSVRNGTGIKNTAKSTYSAVDKSRRTVNVTDADAVVLIRRKGVAPSSKAQAVLASKYLVLTMPKTAASGTPAPTGSTTSTPSVTEAPGPSTTAGPTGSTTPAP